MIKLKAKAYISTLTGGVVAAFTTKEADFLTPIGDWADLPPSKFLATSFEAVKDDDDTRACAAILSL